jgi:hypothetical protein
VGLSGFLYLAIVVGWAVYLVPFALKRYDEATRSRSIDRFSSAMRVLGRGEADAPASGHGDVNPQTATPEAQDGPVPGPARREAHRTAARVAARRRRRVLLTLLLATAATGTAAGLAYLPTWAPAIPGTLLVLWLMVCRSQARREQEVRPARPAPEPDPQRDVDRAPAAGEDAEMDVAVETDPVDIALGQVPADDEPTVVLSREDLQADEGYAGSGSLWDPVPVTLPTYVHKPRAPRTIRTIDLGADGVQSSGRSEESAIYTHRTHAVEQTGHEEAEEPKAEEASERSGPARRAVGE